eukprot:GGOE01006432.1.p1 GENE.GGOE01006432.1~~GGOE01006432.1.p1  ORF type:complete len:515 (-),score=142.47 GGOE01006432.1:644-2158(-)
MPQSACHLKSPNPTFKRPLRVVDDVAFLAQLNVALGQVPTVADSLRPWLSMTRRYLHACPELGGQEVETAEFLVRELRKIPGVEDIRTHITGYGVTALLRGASPLGPNANGKVRRVLLRAEMGGLPIQDPKEGCAYSSPRQGVCHAGFNDCHMTCLLGAAHILSRLREHFTGEALLVFQPSDGGQAGARHMVAQGIVGPFVPQTKAGRPPDEAYPEGYVPSPTVDACLTLHIQLQLPAGTIGVKVGDMTASEDDYHIVVRGKGGHGSVPHLAINPVYVACSLVVQSQSWLSRNTNPFLPTIFCLTTIHGGTKTNVIPDECTVEGTLRTHSDTVRQQANEQLPGFMRSIGEAYDAEVEVTVKHGYAGGVNDRGLASALTHVAKRLLEDGDDVVQIEFPEMGADDFFEFGVPEQEPSIPSLMFWLGAANEDLGITEASANFDVDEQCLHVGASIYAGALLHFFHYGFSAPGHDSNRASPVSSSSGATQFPPSFENTKPHVSELVMA